MDILLASISIFMGIAFYQSVKSILHDKPVAFDLVILAITVILFLHFNYGNY